MKIVYAILRDVGNFEIDLQVTDIGISLEDALMLEKEDKDGCIQNVIVYEVIYE